MFGQGASFPLNLRQGQLLQDMVVTNGQKGHRWARATHQMNVAEGKTAKKAMTKNKAGGGKETAPSLKKRFTVAAPELTTERVRERLWRVARKGNTKSEARTGQTCVHWGKTNRRVESGKKPRGLTKLKGLGGENDASPA